ncbi:hypothetical protein LBMAG30_25430 [Comamonadaceae bacterium]|nr:hypothetical protein LBMAG30_25430 [Comamonadaceae bacterium]
MPRNILSEDQLHPSIRTLVANHEQAIVREVMAAASNHRVLVVGMGSNPYCKKARKALQAAGFEHHYLEYGNYFSMWRQRSALKFWSGWPTFPMVFVKGVLVGGANDLVGLIDRGEFKALMD